jgi:hypothetical protein
LPLLKPCSKAKRSLPESCGVLTLLMTAKIHNNIKQF